MRDELSPEERLGQRDDAIRRIENPAHPVACFQGWRDVLKVGALDEIEALLAAHPLPAQIPHHSPLLHALTKRGGYWFSAYSKSPVKASRWHPSPEETALLDPVARRLFDHAGLLPDQKMIEYWGGRSEGREGYRTILEEALQAGWDTFAIHMLSLPSMQAPGAGIGPDWRDGWKTRYTGIEVKHGAKGTSLRWTQALALCGRHEILDAWLSLPDIGVNDKDSSGHTAIFYATTPEVVEVLLRHGADLSIKPRAKRTIPESWAWLGVDGETLSKMTNLLPGAVQDAVTLPINTLVRHVLKDLPRTERTQYQGDVPSPPPLPETDWPLLASSVSPHRCGDGHLDLLSIDRFMLGLCGAMESDERRILTYRLNESGRSKVAGHWDVALEIATRLLEDAPAPDLAKTQGFGAHLLFARLAGVNEEEEEDEFPDIPEWQEWKMARPEVHPAAPGIRVWLERWEKALGTTPLEKLIASARLWHTWSPLLHKTGPVSREALERDVRSRMEQVGVPDLRRLWNNEVGLAQDIHEQVWQQLLRTPGVSGPVMGEFLDEGPYGDITVIRKERSSGQVSALYSAMVQSLIELRRLVGNHEWLIVALDHVLDEWLAQDVPWVPEASDLVLTKKTKAKNGSTLERLPQAGKIRAVVEKGRLGHVLREAGDASGEGEAPKRRRL